MPSVDHNQDSGKRSIVPDINQYHSIVTAGESLFLANSHGDMNTSMNKNGNIMEADLRRNVIGADGQQSRQHQPQPQLPESPSAGLKFDLFSSTTNWQSRYVTASEPTDMMSVSTGHFTRDDVIASAAVPNKSFLSTDPDEVNLSGAARTLDLLGLDDHVSSLESRQSSDLALGALQSSTTGLFSSSSSSSAEMLQPTFGHARALTSFTDMSLASAVTTTDDDGTLTLAEIDANSNSSTHGSPPTRFSSAQHHHHPGHTPPSPNNPFPSNPDTLASSSSSAQFMAHSPALSAVSDSHQTPSRSLWIGNVDPTLSPSDLLAIFSAYGPIESLRVLPEKECAFINFVRIEDAMSAKTEMQGGRVGNCIIKVGYGKAESVSETQGTQPTKSLWVGNLPPTTDPSDLEKLFSEFGPVESARILTHKSCGFVNFERLEDAMKARQAMNGREIGGAVVRIGFAKVPNRDGGNQNNGNGQGNSNGNGNTGGHRRDRSISQSSTTSISPSRPTSSPSSLAASLSASATAAYFEAMNNAPGYNVTASPYSPSPLAKYNVGGETYPMTTNTPPQQNPHLSTPMMPPRFSGATQQTPPFPPTPVSAITSPTIATSMGDTVPSAAAIQSMMNAAGVVATMTEEQHRFTEQLEQQSGDIYASAIPPLPEHNPHRRVDQGRLREMRKKLEGHSTLKDIEAMFYEVIDETADLCTDYIGNVVIQKILERSNDQQRLRLMEKIAPHMAAIGIHKNGTWVVQKMIDCAKTTMQIHLIVEALRPFTPPLLLDQFGNYVVQGALRLGTHRNQFIFDAMHTKCLEIGTGRFGARAMRACLESQYTTKRQQKHVAIAIVQNAVQLCTNPNGAILITWLLDTSSLPGRYRVLAPKLVPHIVELSTHKLASATILKLVTQRIELDARSLIIDTIFYRNDNTLVSILADQVHGVSVIQKILASACINMDEKIKLADRVRMTLAMMSEVKDNIVGYKRLLDELSTIPSAGSAASKALSSSGDWGLREDVVSPLAPATSVTSGPGVGEGYFGAAAAAAVAASGGGMPATPVNPMAFGGSLYGWTSGAGPQQQQQQQQQQLTPPQAPTAAPGLPTPQTPTHTRMLSGGPESGSMVGFGPYGYGGGSAFPSSFTTPPHHPHPHDPTTSLPRPPRQPQFTTTPTKQQTFLPHQRFRAEHEEDVTDLESQVRQLGLE